MRKNHPAQLPAASRSPAESQGDVSHTAALVLSVSRAEPHVTGSSRPAQVWLAPLRAAWRQAAGAGLRTGSR